MVGGGGLNDTAPRFSEPVEPPPEGTPWTVLRLLRWSTAYLREKRVPDARLDVEHLLADSLGMDRLQLYLHFERPVEPAELDRFRPRLRERARRRPLQYILGRSSFRDLELGIDARALIPRTETEELVGAVLDRVRGWERESLTALDVCTGGGAIALSLAQEGAFERVVATDVSAEALALARENAVAAGLDLAVEFREGAGFDPLRADERFDVVVSNPPYVTAREFAGLEPEVREWEPRAALEAGEDGLDVIRELVAGAGAVLAEGGLFAMEFGVDQASAVADLIRGTPGFGTPDVRRDLSRRERMVFATWNGGGKGGAASPSETNEGTAAGESRGDTTRTSTKVRSDVQD